MAPWNSLYSYCDNHEAVINTLRQSLSALDYELYDAFTLIPGKAYTQAVRLFVAPAQAGWVRVIGAPDERQIPALSRLGLCLWLMLDDAGAHIAAYDDGGPVAIQAALTPHLRDDCTPDDLQRALTQTFMASADSESGLPLDALPDDIQDMAENVNMKQAQKMFNRLSHKLLKNAGGEADAARQLLQSSAPDWNSAGGQRLHAVMACLTLPDTWREPDFIALRDAYQLHLRRQRNPAALLLPGDAETMAGVPDALDFTPVYGGINH